MTIKAIERELKRRSMPKRYKRRATMRPSDQALLQATSAELRQALIAFTESKAVELNKPAISERKRKRANAIFAEAKQANGLKAAFQARKAYLG